MTTINEFSIKEELTVYLRNKDILTTTVRGVTTYSDSFTATAGQTVFTLTKKQVRNVRSVTVNAAAKTRYTDYVVDYKDSDTTAYPTVTFSSGLTVSDAVVVSYDYGTTDRIFPDMPRVDLTLESYPRVGIMKVSSPTELLGLGGQGKVTDFFMTIYSWVPVKKEGTNPAGMKDLFDLQYSIRNNILTDAKTFYYFKFINPINSSPIVIPPERNNLVIQASTDYRLFKIFEV